MFRKLKDFWRTINFRRDIARFSDDEFEYYVSESKRIDAIEDEKEKEYQEAMLKGALLELCRLRVQIAILNGVPSSVLNEKVDEILSN